MLRTYFLAPIGLGLMICCMNPAYLGPTLLSSPIYISAYIFYETFDYYKNKKKNKNYLDEPEHDYIYINKEKPTIQIDRISIVLISIFVSTVLFLILSILL